MIANMEKSTGWCASLYGSFARLFRLAAGIAADGNFCSEIAVCGFAAVFAAERQSRKLAPPTA